MRRLVGRAGSAAAILWLIGGFIWFDTGTAFRPPALRGRPAGALLVAAFALAMVWLVDNRGGFFGRLADARNPLVLCLALTVFFRLPLAWWGAAGYTTADGALSGIVALHARDGTAHHVFVPAVPYSGSLKSHLTAVLALVIDPARAFALSSVAFYAFFVAGLFGLALLVDGSPGLALAASLLAAFSPPFVTHYSLSNDGNYVEVLAFGTWALFLAAAWARSAEHRAVLASAMGLLLGLAFWCHILAVLHVAAVFLFLVLADRRSSRRAWPRMAVGFLLGYWPGLLWNSAHHWDSLRSLVPGWQPAAGPAGGPDLPHRVLGLVTDHLPVLLGYDPGNSPAVDALLRMVSVLAIALLVGAVVTAVGEARRRPIDALWLLLLFSLVNLVVVLAALRYVPGNPRYFLFLLAPFSILLARRYARGGWRVLLAVLMVSGALTSLDQARGEITHDSRWRGFVADLERMGVRFCTTDFYVATPINFLSEERIVCSSKLGPTRTEYFVPYRERVDEAKSVALVAASHAQAEKIERRLERLGVGYERRDLMKPVLWKLTRKVDPSEIFPGQSFGVR